MQRKYIHKNEQDDKTSVDPLGYVERRIKFQRQPSDGIIEEEIPQQQTLTAAPKAPEPEEDDVSSKAENIKQVRFANNLKFLQGDSAFPEEKKEFESLGKEFESDKIGQEVSGLLYQFEKQKIAMVQRQIQEEKSLVQELNQKIESNITKFINLESRLKHKQEELEFEVRLKTQKLIESERLAAIGELSSRLAHDLKNPLSVLKIFTDLLRHKTQGESDPAFVRKMDAANAAIFRMTHQIDNVLDFVREAPIERVDTTIHDIIKLAMSRVPLASKINVTVQQQDLPINCDKNKMSVVFTNLLLNAVQAMNGQGSINVAFYKNDSQTVIEFEDSGPGITPEILPKIFDPLFTTKQQGTGLGLATCKNLVGQHGGRILVKNNPTTFSIVLPATNKS